MKTRCGIMALLLLAAGCGTPTGHAPSLVGVWEMKEVRLSRMSGAPQAAFNNRKEIYTANGLYHETAAESTQMTDAKPRRYIFKNGIVTLFGPSDRDILQSKVRFASDKEMELDTPDGDTLVYRKLSDDPARIPKVPEFRVPVRAK